VLGICDIGASGGISYFLLSTNDRVPRMVADGETIWLKALVVRVVGYVIFS